jgi:hypothetical protein
VDACKEFSAMLPISRNWQDAYIISLSKGLNALEVMPVSFASEEIMHHWWTLRQ